MKKTLLTLALAIMSSTSLAVSSGSQVVKESIEVSKFGVIILTKIIVSQVSSPQKVKVKALHDILDLKSKTLIPKGSILSGKTGSMNIDDGTIDLILDTAIIENKEVSIKFKVSSANLSPKLNGEIRDSKGKYLRGAFVSDFSSGAIKTITKSSASGVQSNELLVPVSCCAEESVYILISELYAGDKNLHKVFYVPSGIKAIATPI